VSFAAWSSASRRPRVDGPARPLARDPLRRTRHALPRRVQRLAWVVLPGTRNAFEGPDAVTVAKDLRCGPRADRPTTRSYSRATVAWVEVMNQRCLRLLTLAHQCHRALLQGDHRRRGVRRAPVDQPSVRLRRIHHDESFVQTPFESPRRSRDPSSGNSASRR